MLSNDNNKQITSTGGMQVSYGAAAPTLRTSVSPASQSAGPLKGVVVSSVAQPVAASASVAAPTARVASQPTSPAQTARTAAPATNPAQRVEPATTARSTQAGSTSVQNLKAANDAQQTQKQKQGQYDYPVPQASFLGNTSNSDECIDKSPEQIEIESLKVAKKLHIKKIVWGIISIVGLILCFWICLGCGREDIWPWTATAVVFNHITGVGDFSLADKIVIWDIRLPILIAAMLGGAALSVSGASYQGLFRNPLVSPDILGAAAGAAFGAAMALLWNLDNTLVELCAFAGGFIAVMITWLSASRIGNGANQPLLLVLTGLITATLFQSFVEIIKYIADPYSTLPEITYWLMGSLAKVTWSNLGFFCIPFLIGMIPLLLLRWRLNALSMGDDEAKSLGINVPLMRAIFIFCATLLTAAVVSIAGIVGWVGLIIPHITRFMFGPDNRIVLPMSTVIGGIFLMIVSTVCRSAIASEIPLGVLTSIVGAPLFFVILVKTRLGRTGD